MGKKAKKEVEAPPKDVFDPLNIESKKTGTVVLMLKSEEDEVLSKACEAIYRFADKCDENKMQLLELGAMESLIRLIDHEERLVKRYACMAFGVMAGHPEVRRYLRKTNSITAAIQLLGDEDDVCNEFSSLFLSHMSSDFASKLSISKADGLEPLINLLASPDPDVQKNSVQTICNLVEDFQSRAMVRDLGGIPPLLELLKSDYAIIQELALHTLASVTQDVESRAALRESEGLEQLLSFLGTKEYDDLHVHCLAVLSNCLEDTDSLDEIRNSGGLVKLLGFATDQNAAPEVQAHTADALARTAKNVENGKILHEQETGKTLIALLSSENDLVKVAACHAVASLSTNLAAKEAFGKQEGIPLLVNALASENMEIREAASLALADVTLNNTNNSSEVVNCGGVEQLLTALQNNKDAIVINAICCFINMSKDFNIRSDIFKRGIVSSLIEPLKSKNPHVQCKVCQAIAAYVTGADGRSEIRTRGGLEPLIQHLESNDAEVRRNSAWAVLACLGDPASADAISKLGGLEILQKINDSDQRRTNYSISAFEKLLDSNLSAKYSLTGRLASHNIISDGFFDAGQLRPNSKFESLEELSKQELNQRRPIIVVNCKQPDAVIEVDSPRDEDHTESDGGAGQSSQTDSAKTTQSLKTSSEDASDKGSRVSSKASYTRRKKKDKEAQLREEAERLRAEKEDEEEHEKQILLDSIYRPPVDTTLQGYVSDVTQYIQPMATMKEQVVALAQFVVEKMGGEIERGKLMDFSWELHIAQLKCDVKSNIISLGKIQRGIHYHRALLFKVLADKIGVSCSLVRGEYNRAWNEVLVPASLEKGAPRLPPTRYIIDLIHECGRLIRLDSPEAIQYQSI